jgi:CubicO group peptidase (beta-lactamase class C family)
MIDFDERALIRSLRHVEPAYSFRTTFGYTNITHLLASRIAAEAAGAPDWNSVLRKDLLDPLGMKDVTLTAEALEAAANHAKGHRWRPEGTVEVPITPIFPYQFGGAGNINAHVEDMARWIRLQLGHGAFDGRRIVSPENLAVTHTPKVALSDALTYAMGWYVQQTPNGSIVWHDGDALSFSSFVGLAPDRNLGVVVLANETLVGFPPAIGRWILDRLLGNPKIDHVASRLAEETAQFEAAARQFARPANPRPFPTLAPPAGRFVHPGIGATAVTQDGHALVLRILSTGAQFRLEPWDGDVFVARLMPVGKFAPVVDLDYMTKGFAQFQVDSDGKLNGLSLFLADGQRYVFRRE